MPRSKYIVGNWKMHGSLPDNAARLAALCASVTEQDNVAVCVPFPYLAQTQHMLTQSHIRWGAQNVSEYLGGAYTGEVAVSMLHDFGCHCVIVGHSERRALYGESDGQVATKAKTAAGSGLQAIICVGETLEERESDKTAAVVTRQLSAVLDSLDKSEKARLVVAYEPVWAIGTGRAANPDDIRKMHVLLRDLLRRAECDNTPLLYGGSVKADNAQAILHIDHVDGALVGSASLNPEEFLDIIKAVRP